MKVKVEIEIFDKNGMRRDGAHVIVESHQSGNLIPITLNGETFYVLSSQLSKAIKSCTELKS